MDPRAGYYGASPPGGGGYTGGGAASPSPSLDSVDMTPPVSPAQQNYSTNTSAGMRRRHANGRYGQPDSADDKYRKSRRVVRKLDMFPKVQEDYQVRTDRGGLVALVGYGLALILVLAEVANWSSSIPLSIPGEFQLQEKGLTWNACVLRCDLRAAMRDIFS